MDWRESGNWVSLMVFYGSFNLVVSHICWYHEVLFSIIFIKLFEHWLHNWTCGKLELFINFTTDLFALSFNFSLVLIGEISKQLPNKVNFLLSFFRHGFTEWSYDILALFSLFIDLSQDASQMFVDIFLKNFCQSLRQSSGSQISGIDISINWMVSEILFFLVQGNRHLDLVIDVLLRTVLDSDITQCQRNLLIHDHFLSVGSSVHDVNFSNDT